MNLQFLRNSEKIYSVVLFLQDEDLKRYRQELEIVGQLKHVRMVVQPCPYEGIEFLYRAEVNLSGQRISLDKEVFFQAIGFSPEIPTEKLDQLAKDQYDYLRSILEGDSPKVLKAWQAFEALAQTYL